MKNSPEGLLLNCNSVFKTLWKHDIIALLSKCVGGWWFCWLSTQEARSSLWNLMDREKTWTLAPSVWFCVLFLAPGFQKICHLQFWCSWPFWQQEFWTGFGFSRSWCSKPVVVFLGCLLAYLSLVATATKCFFVHDFGKLLGVVKVWCINIILLNQWAHHEYWYIPN